MASSSGPTAWLGASEAACCEGGGSACLCANRSVISFPSREAGGCPSFSSLFAISPCTMTSSASGAGKEIARQSVERSAVLGRGRHARDHHQLAVRFQPRFRREPLFGIHFQHIGQGGDFLSCRVVEHSRGRQIGGVARIAASSSRLPEGSVLPRPHGNRIEQSGARHRAVHQLLQAHAERQQRHERCHADGNAQRGKRIAKDGLAQIPGRQFGQVPDLHRRRSSRAMAPSDNVTMRSAYCSARARSCVTMTMVLPGPAAGR